MIKTIHGPRIWGPGPTFSASSRRPGQPWPAAASRPWVSTAASSWPATLLTQGWARAESMDFNESWSGPGFRAGYMAPRFRRGAFRTSGFPGKDGRTVACQPPLR
jgi:hypothetical protein